MTDSPPEGPSSSYSLIHLGDLAKPATALSERISDAVGTLYRPTQMVKEAKAQAAAKIILAQADIRISALEERALRRMVLEEGRKQANIESITQQALLDLKPDADPKKIEDDWLAHFFEKARLVSNAELQSIWAKILAGEANAPGAFSRRTIDRVSTLDKSDAELFTTLCGFAWYVGHRLIPLVYDVNDPPYEAAGINFMALAHLEDIGLVNRERGLLWPKLPNRFTVGYYETLVELHRDSDATPDALPLGVVTLTQPGSQLASICGSKPVEGFLDYVLEQWRAFTPIVVTPSQQPPD